MLMNDRKLVLSVPPMQKRDIEVSYVAGYGTRSSSVPAFIAHAIWEHTHHLYCQRDHNVSVPKSVDDVYQTYNKMKGSSDVFAV